MMIYAFKSAKSKYLYKDFLCVIVYILYVIHKIELYRIFSTIANQILLHPGVDSSCTLNTYTHIKGGSDFIYQ